MVPNDDDLVDRPSGDKTRWGYLKDTDLLSSLTEIRIEVLDTSNWKRC